MVKLYEGGAYLLHGTEVIADAPDALAAVKSKTGIETTKEATAKETMAYGILSAHNTSGNMQQLQIKFDKLTSHDITFVGIIQTARASGLEKFPIPYVLTNCHNSLCAVGGTINEDDHMFGLTCAKKYGGVYVPPHQAVIHQFAREMLAGGGKMILGSDSHTRYGALGTMAMGEGGPELVKQLLNKTYDIKMPGVIAGFALIMYTAMELVALNAFDMTLTLSGIAGVILSIGMAVDANVIIYARIREEIAEGKTVRSAINIGFKKALTAIIDGNVTTLIAAFVLNFMATGSVKGFAQTLALGIVISMFTACVISRIIVNAAYGMGMQDEKYFGRAKELKTIRFVERRKVFFAIALVFILSGPAAMLINSGAGNGVLNLSMDFKGGTSTDVTFNEDYDINQIDSDIKPVIQEVIGDAEIQAQKVAGGTEVIFKTRALDMEEREALESSLDENFGIADYTNEEGETEKNISFETISSTVSSEMRSDAVLAVVVAVICMLIYIWFRFSDIRFATSAVLALCHDVLVVFACYAIVRISVGSTFIACMLTIVGYSINATIVIFDRIRENLRERGKNEPLAHVVNKSITQTLTRSVYTSFTTFVTIAALYVVGVPTIKEFALPLMVGIVAGGFSSVCITGPLWYMMKVRSDQKAALEEQKGGSSGKKNKK